jgi:hypothetical protein
MSAVKHTMKRNFQPALLGIFIALTFTTSCESNNNKSPSQVVTAAYMAANKGMYAEAKNYFTTDDKFGFSLDWSASSGDTKDANNWDRITLNRTIQKIEILKERKIEESISVVYRVYFKDGKTYSNEAILQKQKPEQSYKIFILLGYRLFSRP